MTTTIAAGTPLSIGEDVDTPTDAAAQDEWAWDVAEALRGMYPDEAARMRDQNRAGFVKYQTNPTAYIKDVLQVDPQPKQIEIANLLLTPPYKVIAVSANNIGKSFLAGSLVNWFYDSFAQGVCITTAPTKRDVEDVLWAQVRSQRRTSWDFAGPRSPELFDSKDHYAKGYTGNTPEAFHGRHYERMFFVMDEAIALKLFVWHGLKSMFKRTGKHHLLALLNPTDTTSPVYAEAESGNYHVVRLSALDHPNVIAQLKGNPAPIPGAVDLDQLAEWFDDPEKFEVIHPDDLNATDVVWPPPWADQYGALERYGGKRMYLRPGPEGQARVLGLWPTSSPGAVWSDMSWKSACRELDGMRPKEILWRSPPEIGCDVAEGTADRSDKSEIVVQIEGCALEHRVGGGWDVLRTASEVKELVLKWQQIYNGNRPHDVPFLPPEMLPIKIDDIGVGSGVTAILRGWGLRAVPIDARTVARHPEKYPIMRDELWFAVPLAAMRGGIDLSRLSKRSQNELRRQALAVRWGMEMGGRRKVEPKKETKKRIGRSPDSMDALNLSFCAAPLPASGGVESLKTISGPLPGNVGELQGPRIIS